LLDPLADLNPRDFFWFFFGKIWDTSTRAVCARFLPLFWKIFAIFFGRSYC
jgi:hypothetical protein